MRRLLLLAILPLLSAAEPGKKVYSGSFMALDVPHTVPAKPYYTYGWKWVAVPPPHCSPSRTSLLVPAYVATLHAGRREPHALSSVRPHNAVGGR